MARIMVVDTETTSIEKPFAYNIGFLIADTETEEILHKADFVCEQIWHNRELFTTAYFSDKRDWYIEEMRKHNIIMEKIGYITQAMARLIKAYDVQAVYAYNSPFDDGVFRYNCDWFKIINPFDDIPFYDILKYAYQKIGLTDEYKKFCEENNFFTEKQHYPMNAETIYKYLTKNTDFVEAHTALADSLIEYDILRYCIKQGAEWHTHYDGKKYIPREVEKTLEVRDVDGNSNYFPYKSMRSYSEKDNKSKIILK